ncbi:EamA family transporter [Azospirillum sp. Marseille-Q6669]|jgi:EamA-like transporter family.
MLKYLFLAGTLLFTVYGQLIIKARAGVLASDVSEGAGSYLLRMFLDPLVITGFAGAGMAALCWLLAVRSLPIVYAYPFMALSFVLVPCGAALFLGEVINWPQMVGLALIVAGVALTAVFR